MSKEKWLRSTGLVVVLALAAMISACSANPSETNPEDCVYGLLPKTVGNEYWAVVGTGAKEAAAELGIELDYNGPATADASGQTQFIDSWVQQGYCAIGVSAADANALAPALKRAQDAGLKVSTFDADTDPSVREVFLSQASPAGIGATLVDTMAELAGESGDFLVITSTLTAPNQSQWVDELTSYMAATYPNMNIAAVLPGEEDNAKSRDVALGYLRANPDTSGIIAVTQAVPGIAEAKKQLGITTLPIIGIGPPSCCKAVLEDGSADAMILWNPIDLGYAAVYLEYAQVNGSLTPKKGSTIDAGRLGTMEFISDDTVLLGDPMVFTKDNMNEFNF